MRTWNTFLAWPKRLQVPVAGIFAHGFLMLGAGLGAALRGRNSNTRPSRTTPTLPLAETPTSTTTTSTTLPTTTTTAPATTTTAVVTTVTVAPATTRATTATTAGQGNSSSAYPTVCIPSAPPDLDAMKER